MRGEGRGEAGEAGGAGEEIPRVTASPRHRVLFLFLVPLFEKPLARLHPSPLFDRNSVKMVSVSCSW